MVNGSLRSVEVKVLDLSHEISETGAKFTWSQTRYVFAKYSLHLIAILKQTLHVLAIGSNRKSD